jgi:zinc transport system ATP-binding protein
VSDSSVISIRELSFSYDGPKILEGINLEVSAGEFLGIVGPNAGGKSTLLKIILGLLQPTSGQIEVLGRSPLEARRQIGYVPQYPEFRRDFPITVVDLVLMGRLGGSTLFGRYRQQDREIADRAMERTEISGLAGRRIGTLSGGQLQRALVARALACRPQLLLLDEPTANIDLRMESDIFDLLQQLKDSMTIIVVSHDVGFISNYVSRVACLARTLMCHHATEIDGKMISTLYAEPVQMIEHLHQ